MRRKKPLGTCIAKLLSIGCKSEQNLGPGFCFPDLQTSRILFLVVAEFVVFGDSLGSSMRRGRAPADNSDVLAMFRLVYSGEGATQPLVDDSS